MVESKEVHPGNGETASSTIVKFCPICGEQMYQGMRYGFLCWVCPECDYDEPVK